MAIVAAAPGPAPGFAKNPDKLLDFEPCPRRVRVKVAGETVADSTGVMLMREGGHLPVYYFPMADIRMELFVPTDQETHCGYKGHASYWTLTVGDRVEENVMWSYRNPYDEMLQIKDYAAFYWNRVDSWWEEDEEIFKHPRDPRHRVDAILSHRPVTVTLGGDTVAETENAVFVFETNHPVRYYIPRADVRMDLLTPTETKSTCPYKGDASYFSAIISGETFEDIAWSYENPVPECPKIKDLICFFHENIDAISVDGEEVEKPVTKWSK
jgi:uncharacterized protein (DUF427 family)